MLIKIYSSVSNVLLLVQRSFAKVKLEAFIHPFDQLYHSQLKMGVLIYFANHARNSILIVLVGWENKLFLYMQNEFY